MTEKINGHAMRPTDVGTRRSESAKAATSTGKSGSAATTQAPARPSDTVNLTASGKLMLRLAEVVRSSSGVDTERVAAIKDAIASGTYKVDDQRTADQMLRMEKEILS